MLIYFIHGVATKDASYAKKLINLIQEECKRQNQPLPHCHAGFWGNVLMGTAKLWRDIDQELQIQKQKDGKFNPDKAFRFQNFRKEYFSYFIGDAFSYLSSDRGGKIRRIIADQLIDLVRAHPAEEELHIVAHSLGTVILWDVLFSDRFPTSDPAHEIRSLIGKERGKVSLSSVTTMGSPIPFLNLTLGIDTNQIQNFLERHQKNRLIWNNLINSYDIIAYPIRPLFDTQVNSSKILVTDHYLEAITDLFDSVEIASVVFNSLNAHSYYLGSDKVAKIIMETIHELNKSKNNRNAESVHVAVYQLVKTTTITEDKSQLSRVLNLDTIVMAKKFRDGSGQIKITRNPLGLYHLYVLDRQEKCLYAGYSGFLHDINGLKQTFETIVSQFC